MANQKSIASLLIFVGTSLCFFLPFVTVSCGGITAFTLSGQQMVTGTTLTQPQPFGPPQKQKLDGDPFAAIAALCAIAGIALSLIGKRMAVATASSGSIGALSLVIMRSRLEGQIQHQSQGLATVTYEAGFTLVTLLLIVSAIWNFYLAAQGKRIAMIADKGVEDRHDSESRGSPEGRIEDVHRSAISPHLAAQEQAKAVNEPTDCRFCGDCGQSVTPGARFCDGCGSPTNDATQSEIAATGGSL